MICSSITIVNIIHINILHVHVLLYRYTEKQLLPLTFEYTITHFIVLYIFIVLYLDLMKPGFGLIGNNIKNAAFNCFTNIVYKNKYLT